MNKNIPLIGLLMVATSCSTFRFRSNAEKEGEIRPIITPMIISELQKQFPKNKKYWAGWGLLEFKNGEPIKLVNLEMSKEALSISDYSEKNFVQTDGFVSFEQGKAKQTIRCHFAFDVKDNKAVLANLNYGNSIHQKPNPECTDMGDILREDPIKEFRRYPKKVIKAINDRTVYIGMPEEALIVAAPHTTVNSTNIMGHETKQYVEYSNYYYVENGVVTAIQHY